MDSRPRLRICCRAWRVASWRAIARRWSNVAAILGGHTHDMLAQPEIVNGVPIAHPGAHAEHVGRLELEIQDGASRVVAYELLPLRAPR
jgi:2',3'-cyclic-nucleotide 2'-phosphodiesterase (5'-nucleotidase family)